MWRASQCCKSAGGRHIVPALLGNQEKLWKKTFFDLLKVHNELGKQEIWDLQSHFSGRKCQKNEGTMRPRTIRVNATFPLDNALRHLVGSNSWKVLFCGRDSLFIDILFTF